LEADPGGMKGKDVVKLSRLVEGRKEKDLQVVGRR
jgi:hypothetical protein